MRGAEAGTLSWRRGCRNGSSSSHSRNSTSGCPVLLESHRCIPDIFTLSERANSPAL
jgi:hypothetical protein